MGGKKSVTVSFVRIWGNIMDMGKNHSGQKEAEADNTTKHLVVFYGLAFVISWIIWGSLAFVPALEDMYFFVILGDPSWLPAGPAALTVPQRAAPP